MAPAASEVRAQAPVRAEVAPVAAPAPVAPRGPVGPAAIVARSLPGDFAGVDWEQLQQAVGDWAAGLRRKPVFGTGDLRPDWLCIGDPPMEDEERQGLPFVGDGGRLMDNMLAAVGASRQRGAYLTNVLKCRLPEDRSQESEQVAQSLAFLQRQIELLQPRVIFAMGRLAVQWLLQSNDPMGKLRGRLHAYNGIPLVVSYTPAYLLRTLPDKGKAWADLCLAQSVLREPG
jgi:uracil-DNA glycosylase